MSANDKEIKVEVSSDGDYLLITISVSKYTCASCNVTYREKLDIERIKVLLKSNQPLDMFFRGPCAEAGWGRIYNNFEKVKNPNLPWKSALLCAKCYAPICAAEKESEDRKLEATIRVAATVKTWPEL